MKRCPQSSLDTFLPTHLHIDDLFQTLLHFSDQLNTHTSRIREEFLAAYSGMELGAPTKIAFDYFEDTSLHHSAHAHEISDMKYWSAQVCKISKVARRLRRVHGYRYDGIAW